MLNLHSQTSPADPPWGELVTFVLCLRFRLFCTCWAVPLHAQSEVLELKVSWCSTEGANRSSQEIVLTCSQDSVLLRRYAQNLGTLSVNIFRGSGNLEFLWEICCIGHVLSCSYFTMETQQCCTWLCSQLYWVSGCPKCCLLTLVRLVNAGSLLAGGSLVCEARCTVHWAVFAALTWMLHQKYFVLCNLYM